MLLQLNGMIRTNLEVYHVVAVERNETRKPQTLLLQLKGMKRTNLAVYHVVVVERNDTHKS